ncbi:hypothetical protein [Alistipes sp.]|uniref:DUF4906 domain-containing protein n=1 Tax=Alistipes sp. TaxID=1872444 RepID=UPI003AF843CD
MRTDVQNKSAAGLFGQRACGPRFRLFPRVWSPVSVRLAAAALLTVALLWGCSKEPFAEPGRDNPDPGGTVTAQISLAPDFMPQIDVKSVSGANEDIVKDVWVIQLNSAGTAQLQNPQYVTAVTATGGACKITVSLIPLAGKVYFLANTHNQSLCTSSNVNTVAKVEALKLAVANEGSLASANGIPMSGVWSGTPDKTTGIGNISLTRAVAKLTFNLKAGLPSGDSFTLKSVKVKKVPKAVSFYRSNPAATPFPATSVGWFDNYASLTFDEVLSPTAKTQWWYLPENMRGTGSASNQRNKTAATAPSGQGSYCTYIEVSGAYTTANGLTSNVVYTIFLGANNTKDYNLKRNIHYTVTTTITGQAKSDTRITRTPENYLDYTDEGTSMFAIATSDLGNINWTTAVSSCPVGWRVPTQMDLMLMWIYKGGLGSETFRDDNVYWSSSSYDSSMKYYMSLGNGDMSCNAKNTRCYVRCVRDY